MAEEYAFVNEQIGTICKYDVLFIYWSQLAISGGTNSSDWGNVK